MIRLEDIFIIDFGDYKKKEKMYKTDDRHERNSPPRRIPTSQLPPLSLYGGHPISVSSGCKHSRKTA